MYELTYSLDSYILSLLFLTHESLLKTTLHKNVSPLKTIYNEIFPLPLVTHNVVQHTPLDNSTNPQNNICNSLLPRTPISNMSEENDNTLQYNRNFHWNSSNASFPKFTLQSTTNKHKKANTPWIWLNIYQLSWIQPNIYYASRLYHVIMPPCLGYPVSINGNKKTN